MGSRVKEYAVAGALNAGQSVIEDAYDEMAELGLLSSKEVETLQAYFDAYVERALAIVRGAANA